MMDELQRRRLKVIERREETLRQVLGELEDATQYDPRQREYRVQMEELLGRTRDLAIRLDGRTSEKINSLLGKLQGAYIGSLEYLDKEFSDVEPEVEEVTLKMHAPMFTIFDMYLMAFGK